MIPNEIYLKDDIIIGKLVENGMIQMQNVQEMMVMNEFETIMDSQNQS